jgi:hypothetical protein
MFETTAIKRYPSFRSASGAETRMLSLLPQPADVIRAAPQLKPLFE